MTKKLVKPKIIVIVGPTASGKSELALRLANKFNGEIVSADSRQIYRGMDVGTAKPSKKERGLIPHHLIDIKNPNREYTVQHFKADALKVIREIIKRGKLPILVGGTGLYIKAIVDNLKIPKVKPDFVLRRELENEFKEKGIEPLIQELVKIDPDAACIVDSKNPRRVIRALEISLGEKKLFSGSRRLGKPLFQTLQIGVGGEGNGLRARIERRSEEMFQGGLIQEVERLVKKYPSTSSGQAPSASFDKTQDKSLGASGLPRAFDAIGYRETIDYLGHKITKEKLMELLTKNTWQYARRQMTWFKKDPRIYWVKNEKEAMKLAAEFLS